MKTKLVVSVLAGLMSAAFASTSFGQLGLGTAGAAYTAAQVSNPQPQAAANENLEPQIIERYTVTGKKLEPLSPPKMFKIERIEASTDGVQYVVGFKNDSTSVSFYTDRAGKLVGFHAVVDDHNAAIFDLVNGSWVASDSNLVTHQVGFDCAAWAKFFSEKVSPPVPVVVRDEGSGSLVIEKAAGVPPSWTLVGYSDEPDGRYAMLGDGSPNLRKVKASDFALPPKMGARFKLAQIGGKGKFLPVDLVNLDGKENGRVGWVLVTD